MKHKKLILFILAAAMALAFAVPVASYAEDDPVLLEEPITTLDGLKDALIAGGSYQLGANIEDVNETLTVEKEVSLDLNGFKVTSTTAGTYAFNLSDSLTVYGTEPESGIVLGNNTSAGIFKVSPGANLSIIGTGNEANLFSGETAAGSSLIFLEEKGAAPEGATISLTDVNASTNYSILTSDGGNALINVSGGVYTCSATTSEGQRAFYLNYDHGDFEGTAITCGHGPAIQLRGEYTAVIDGIPTVVPSVISDCSLTNTFSDTGVNYEVYDRSALFLSKKAQATVESGSFTGCCGAFLKGTDTFLNVEDGVFTGTEASIATGYLEIEEKPKAKLSGGTFNGPLQEIHGQGTGETIEVTGGEYTVDPTKFIPVDPEGNKICDVDCFGNYYIVTEHEVAEIDGTTYPTLESAFAAAGEDDEIILLKDIKLSQPISVSNNLTGTAQKNISLNLNQHNITSTASSSENGILFNVKDAFLDIYGEGTLRTTSTTGSVTIRVEGRADDGNDNERYGICVDDDVTIVSSSYGVIVSNGSGNVAYNAGVELNGCNIKAGTAAVCVPACSGAADAHLPYIDMNCIADNGEYALLGEGTAEYFVDGAELAGTTAAIAVANGYLEIKGADFDSSNGNALALSGNAYAVIKGGSFTSSKADGTAVVLSENAKAKIAGGFFTAKGNALSIGADASATIDGGTFDSKKAVIGSGTGEIIIADGYYKGSDAPLDITNDDLTIAGGYYSKSIKENYGGKFAIGLDEVDSTAAGYPKQVKNTATSVTVTVTDVDTVNNTAKATLKIGDGDPINVNVEVKNAVETPITALDVETLVKEVQAKGGITSTSDKIISFWLNKEFIDVSEDGKTMTYDVSPMATVDGRDIEVSDNCLKENVNFNLDVGPMDIGSENVVYVTNNGATEKKTVEAHAVGIQTRKLGTFVISTEVPPVNPTESTYMVTFDSNGGSAVSSQKVEYGKTATKPADPTKTDNLFDGWYADSTLKTPYDFSTPVKSDFTLYAKWLTKGNNADIKATDTARSATDSEGNALVQNKDYTLKEGGADFAASYTDTFRETRTVNIVIGDKFYVFTVSGTRFAPIDINTLTVTVRNGVYTGEFVAPKVTITDADGKEIDAKYYDIAIPESSIAVGSYKAKITGKDDYTGTVEKSYKINPPAKAIKRVAKGRKSFTVKWKKASATERGGFDKYQVRYSMKKSMKGAKAKTAKKTASKLTVKKLEPKKTYYVQLRTYKTVDGVKYYSKWSKKKSVKTK